MSSLLAYFAAAFGAAVPLVLAALGGVLSERVGIACIALEGYVLAGAFAAAVGALATNSVFIALVAAALAGAFTGGLFAFSVVRLRANAIVAGVAMNLFCAAGTRVALKVLYDSASNSPPILSRASRSGSVGTIALLELFTQPTLWVALVSLVLVHGLFWRTAFGLRLRAAGEHAEALSSLGVSVERVRAGSLVLGGALAGLGGAHLSLSQHEFVAYMSNGRGFLALAAVILGGWRPVPAAVAALAIGSLGALDASLAGRVRISPAILQSIPFLVTLLAVVGLVGRVRAPAELGR